jgi:pSer/pThr/pTyr-binding forkhead associated (FHA) protein
VPLPVLSILRIVLLILLYVFLARVVRVVITDLYGPRHRRTSPPPRPQVASAQPPRTPRRRPREAVVHPPSGAPQVVVLVPGEPFVIGRLAAVAVTVDDAYVSDEHAEITSFDEDWILRDLGSTNGTYLNGAKVIQPAPLSAGDQIRVGKTRIEMRR